MIVIEVEGSLDERTSQTLRNAIIATRILRRIHGRQAIAVSATSIFDLNTGLDPLKSDEPITIRINNRIAISVDKPPEPNKIVEWALETEKSRSKIGREALKVCGGGNRFISGSVLTDLGKLEIGGRASYMNLQAISV